MVLGLQYTFSALWWRRGSPSEDSPHAEHNFVVTRDRNKKYHVFKYTSVHGNVLGEHVGNTEKISQPNSNAASQSHANDSSNLFWATNKHARYSKWSGKFHGDQHAGRNDGSVGDSAEHCAQSQQCGNLKIVTYNIWNVNGILEDSYEDRLKRMGEVCIEISMHSLMLIIISFIQLCST